MSRHLSLVIVLFVFLTALHGQKASPLSESGTLKHEAYLFGFGGEFLSFDFEDKVVTSFWYLPKVAGLENLLPPYCAGLHVTSNDCTWLPVGLAASASGDLFGVFPGKGRTGEIGVSPALLFHLKSRPLTLIGERNSPGAAPVLISNDGTKLFLNYSSTDGAHNQISATIITLDPRTLQEKTRATDQVKLTDYEQAKVDLNTLLSPDAYSGGDGTVIYDGLNRIRLSAARAVKQKIDPVATLTTADREKLKAFSSSGNTRDVVNYGVLDSKDHWTLVGVVESSRMALWAVDLDEHRTTPVMIAPAGRAWLLDKDRVVVQPYAAEVTPTMPASQVVLADKLLLIDLATGAQKSEVSSDFFAGALPQHLQLCSDAAHSRGLYRGGRDLLFIDFATKEVQVIKVGFDLSTGVQCRVVGHEE